MDKREFQDVIDTLLKTAMKDYTLSKDEHKIISTSRITVAKYLEMVDMAKEDGVIDEQEKVRLQQLKDEILQEAEHVALLDGNISEDEQKLLDALGKVVRTNLSRLV